MKMDKQKENSLAESVRYIGHAARYRLPGRFFKKYWFWFVDPADVENVDMATFFSYNNIEAPGFKRRTRLTSIIDLSQDLDLIWSKMRKSFICRQIEKGERNGIIVKQDNNFFEFKKIYYRFRRNKKLHGDRFESFEQNGVEFSAYFSEKMIAGGIFIEGNGCMRALVLASERLGGIDGRMRDIIGQANRLLIWEAVKYAKKNGFSIFDLGGIAPDSKDKGQRTLSEFKESFGGERRNSYYYTKVYSKLLKFWLRLKKIK